MPDWSWTPAPSMNASVRMQRAAGVDLELVEAGPAGSPRLAILLHGFPELNFSWRHQIPLLAERGWRVWAPNQRGYGASDKPKDVTAYHIDRLTADIAALIDAARADGGAEEVMLVAHDWGGAVAWDFAIRRVRPLSRLVIMNMPHPWCFTDALETSRAQRRRSWYVGFFQLPWLPEWIMTRRNARAVRRAFSDMALDKERFPSEALDVYAAAARRPGSMRSMIHWYRAAARAGRDRMRPSPPEVDVPTLMIWGEGDTALGPETLAGVGAYVPGLTLHRLPRVSHWVQQDAPEKVNRLLADWLDAAPRSPNAQ